MSLFVYVFFTPVINILSIFVGFTEVQERKIRIIIERNIYYKENPFLLKNYFSKKDTAEVDEKIKVVK